MLRPGFHVTHSAHVLITTNGITIGWEPDNPAPASQQPHHDSVRIGEVDICRAQPPRAAGIRSSMGPVDVRLAADRFPVCRCCSWAQGTYHARYHARGMLQVPPPPPRSRRLTDGARGKRRITVGRRLSGACEASTCRRPPSGGVRTS
eukprot:TRINITY_DN25575_c0_g1_i1.p2 TRINITY_DN25575_c0_g1~~TRINITY_DN25575_c0_g1_i1.p2  ORF type:complete len:148 (+),score=3.60 TRINITY_DN25575_c0_g1_i1:202-645(+)